MEIDEFDLDISVVESGGTAAPSAASDGGCGSTGGSSCTPSGA